MTRMCASAVTLIATGLICFAGCGTTGTPAGDPIPGPQGPAGDIGATGATGPQGLAGADGAAGPKGDTGAAGAPGADGQLRIYGDGSLGDVTVASSMTLAQVTPNFNTQFKNLTINSGATLTIPSGAVLRIAGMLTNNGTIAIASGDTDANTNGSPGAGVSHQSATNGVGAFFSPTSGGFGGVPLTADEAQVLLAVDSHGGGAGAASGTNAGGSGGGRALILARTAIVNAGTISANGAPGTSSSMAGSGGAGGGAGGVLLIASAGSITNSGTISASGGSGGTGLLNSTCSGGGGGGGIVHLLAPSITAGTINVAGGAGGPAEGITSGFPVLNATTGAGAGACAGAGGNGGGVDGGNNLLASQQGAAGVAITSQFDPTAYF